MSAARDRLTVLAQTLGHAFAEPELLREALTHASVGQAAPDYQRLEFLGDRVLGLVIADLLLRSHPDEAEGALSRRHTALVRAETLAETAEDIGLGDYLILAPGEESAGVQQNRALLADVCEAVIGAIYLDGGLAAAADFIAARWGHRLGAAVPPRDAKTALQEWAQGRGRPLPQYRTLGHSGPDHDPVFTVEVRVDGLPPATAEGASKRAAGQAAAAKLLEAARGETDPSDG